MPVAKSKVMHMFRVLFIELGLNTKLGHQKDPGKYTKIPHDMFG